MLRLEGTLLGSLLLDYYPELFNLFVSLPAEDQVFSIQVSGFLIATITDQMRGRVIEQGPVGVHLIRCFGFRLVFECLY